MIVEELLENYEKRLNELYARANTKSKKKRVVIDLISFKQMTENVFGINKIYDWDKDSDIKKLLINNKIPFLQNIINTSGLYYTIFSNALEVFLSSDFDAYEYYGKPYQRLTRKEEKELICTFLNSFDQKLVKIYEDKMKNSELFRSSLEEFNGLTYTFPSLNKTIIFYNSYYGSSIDTASTLVHELGHNYEMNTLYRTGRNDFFGLTYKVPFYEVTPRFLEYSFLKFLEENNILTEDTKKRIHTHLFDLLIRTYEINLIYNIENIEIDENEVIHLQDDSLKEEVEDIEKILNYYSLQKQTGDTIKYRQSFIYGMGSLIGIHLYEAYKQDPKYFQKELPKVILNYPDKGLEAYNPLGVTKEELIENNVLKRILKQKNN